MTGGVTAHEVIKCKIWHPQTKKLSRPARLVHASLHEAEALQLVGGVSDNVTVEIKKGTPARIFSGRRFTGS